MTRLKSIVTIKFNLSIEPDHIDVAVRF